MDSLIRDVRQALRLLASNRGFAAAALLTIALGVGGTTTVFSVVYGVLLRPLPYAEPERLVRVSEVHPGANAPFGGARLSQPTFHAWARSSATLESIGAFRVDFTASGFGVGTTAQRVPGTRITPSVWRMLRVSPFVGRFFGDAEVQPGATPVVVLAYATWRERFGGDPAIVGGTVSIDDVPHQVIGVAPPGFAFPARDSISQNPDGPREIAFYAPLVVPLMAPDARVIGVVDAIARLRPGVTTAQAETEGTALARAVDRPFADLVYGKGGPVEVRVRSIADQMTMTVRPALLVLAAGIGLVLLIAVANLANLFLSRGADRARELAVRAALGADRRRLLRQLLTENLVISLTGGVLGMFLGWALTAAVPTAAPSGFPRLEDIRVDVWFLLVAALAAIFVGTLSGVVPAWGSSRIDLVAAMHAGSGGRHVGVGTSTGRFRRVLLIVEAALAVVLLVGALLLARSFVRLVQVDPGYDPANVLTAGLHLPAPTAPVAAAKGASDDKAAAATKDASTRGMRVAASVLERVRAMPGVRAAGAGSMTPFGSVISSSGFALPGMTTSDGRPVIARALQAVIMPGYAEALGLRLKEGRFLGAEDATAASIAMLVNETFARMYFSDGRPIVGRRFVGMFPRILGRNDAVVEIVGVVADLLPDAFDARPQPQIYVPAGVGFGIGNPTFVIKTAGDPVAIAPVLREIVRQVDGAATLDRVGPLADKISDSMGQPRFAALVLAAFAALALSLATTGLYGVLSYNITQRRREIGLRAALGATRGGLLWLVLREELTVTAIGLVIGVAIASLATRAMEGLLFGVTTLDGVAFTAAPLLLLLVAGAACLIPAQRAAALDPAKVLQAE